MMHGSNNLDKAIELLDNKEKNDFKNFVNTNVSFNPQNMLICKSKKILIYLIMSQSFRGSKDVKMSLVLMI